MMGKFLVSLLLVCCLLGGGVMYYLQVHAYYDEVTLARDGGETEMLITDLAGRETPLALSAFQGIDSTSSPIRFRACFTVEPESLAQAQPAPFAVPLTAPAWFDCYDARAIGDALETEEATAYLGQSNVIYGIDRLIAVFPDGRAYAWQQLNTCGQEVFDGNMPPPGCPPVPEGDR